MDPLPDALPKVIQTVAEPEIKLSPALSLMARGPDDSIAARKVAILVAHGIAGKDALAVHKALFSKGAVPRFVAPRIGSVKTTDGNAVEADASLENEPGVLFDALVLPQGPDAVDALSKDAHTMEFIKDQYRHGKTLLVLGASRALLKLAGIAPQLPDGSMDPGIVMADGANSEAMKAFMEAMAKHRHPQRETDPPRV